MNTGSIICFTMAAVNVPFIINNPSGAVMNWASAVFCCGLGLACAAMHGRR